MEIYEFFQSRNLYITGIPKRDHIEQSKNRYEKEKDHIKRSLDGSGNGIRSVILFDVSRALGDE